MNPSTWQLPTLHTQRLTLEPLVDAHGLDEVVLADMLAVKGEADVVRFLPYGQWQNMDDARGWVQRMRLRMTKFEAAIWLMRLEGRVIGDLLLFNFDADNGCAEFGYVMGRAHWGKGLMHEAAHAICVYAQAQEGLFRLHAKLDPNNTASAKVLQRLGFHHEGTQRQAWKEAEGRSDCALYGLLQGELVAA